MRRAAAQGAWLFLAALAGFAAGAWDHSAQLAKCQRQWHACDLTAEGQTRVVGDTYDKLQTCELGLDAADSVISKINDSASKTELQLAVCRASVRKCEGTEVVR